MLRRSLRALLLLLDRLHPLNLPIHERSADILLCPVLRALPKPQRAAGQQQGDSKQPERDMHG
ncbi:hypothetical protein [Collimonas pratensis]|uniref:hypothetical protein n=1 Tax=Collimonas pratensis TaxID=279113 RepID=UPI001F0FE97D|nr:hypothetical protein [Collimonas pratensis]